MRRLALIVLLVIAAPAVQAETLTIAVSTPVVKIDSSFTGADITVFGVIGQDKGAVTPPARYKVAVVMVGPTETVVARRKERMLGIWANRSAQTIIRPPSFYAVTTSDELDTVATPAVLRRLQVGFDNIAFVYDGHPIINDPDAEDFRNAFIRLKQRAGLFREEQGVTFIGDLIFRSTTRLPANTPFGRYTVLAYLFAGEALIAHSEASIDVSTTGLEASVASFSRNQSLFYGVICAALALFVGWLGGVIFRRD